MSLPSLRTRTRRRPVLRPLVPVALLAALVLGACGGGNNGVPETGSPSNGQRLFAAGGVNCVQCHTDPATLRRSSEETALAVMIGSAVERNVGRMGDPTLNLRSLTAQDRQDLAAYVLRPPAASPPAGGPSAPVEPAPAPPPSTPAPPAPPPPSAPPAPPAPPPPTSTPAALNPPAAPGTLVPRSSTFASGLASPWGMAWLPDGRLLVAQKGGALVLLAANGSSRSTLAWPSPGPQIRDGGQGGLLGLAVDPDFAAGSPFIYFSYQEPGSSGQSGTAVARVQLRGSVLSGFERLLQQQPKVGQDGVHFGSRLAFLPDKTLLVTLGDRGQDNPSSPDSRFAQNPSVSLGKILRVARDGSTPTGNPSFPGAGALPQLWSIGHRNPQGLAVDRSTGAVWSTEHGPQGGDELNRILPGRNYGWPLRSYGCQYGASGGTACRAGGGVHAPLNGVNFTEPLTAWVPTSTAPSNLIVLRGSGFTEWDGQILIGALAGTGLWRVAVDASSGAVSRTQLLQGLGRVRDITQGPDGWVYVATDDGRIVRLER